MNINQASGYLGIGKGKNRMNELIIFPVFSLCGLSWFGYASYKIWFNEEKYRQDIQNTSDNAWANSELAFLLGKFMFPLITIIGLIFVLISILSLFQR